MDYNGLKLICSWMIDIDNLKESESLIECKLKMLHVLTKMSIKNKTIVEESKLLDIVKRWSDSASILSKSPADCESEETGLSSHEWIKAEIDKMIDKAVGDAPKVDETQQSDELSYLAKQLKQTSNELYEEWSNLKQGFKIPKKQRIEERKEHERELNSSTELSPDQHSNMASNESTSYEKRYGMNEKSLIERKFKSIFLSIFKLL